ncbi:hypothetical protein [Micromonospora sp. CA-244673]|uniref:hypothetical protein n=1 Tax=Micromonospora sp. CA-244673 TaxID=3239958 RepID=UPI003D8F42E3
MTGTPGEDDSSHAGETIGSSRAGETDTGCRAAETSGSSRAAETSGSSRAGETASGSPGGGRGWSVEGGRGWVPTRDRWEGWLARARELWSVAWRGAKRLWRAARPVLEQLRWQEMESAPVTLVDRRAAPTLLVPAQGQVYHFVVRTTFTWTSDHARPELFGWYVDQFQPRAMQRLRRIAVRCAADIPPDQPRAFALALDDAMTGDDTLPWGYERGGVRFTCEPDVSVHLDEPVRELLRPYWDKRIALEWKRDLERRRAEYAEEERKRRPTKTQDDGAEPTAGMPEAQDNGTRPEASMPEAQDNGARPEAGTPEAQDNGARPEASMPEAQDNGARPEAGTPERQDNGARPEASMPEVLREEHPPRQRTAEGDGAARRAAEPGQREAGASGVGRRPGEPGQWEAGAGDARPGPRPPDSPVEQWTPLEPFPQPPAPHPAPGQRPAPAPQGETTPTSAQPGETTPAPGDPDSPGPPDA